LLLVCDALAESLSELEEYVESIDADLFQLEEEIYGGELDEEEEDDELLDEDFVRAECPRCGEEVYFEESLLYDDNVEISCPECGEILFRGNNNGRFDPEDEEEPVAPLTDNQELSECPGPAGSLFLPPTLCSPWFERSPDCALLGAAPFGLKHSRLATGRSYSPGLGHTVYRRRRSVAKAELLSTPNQ